MKKRIIAFLLLIALAVGVLASCGYSYSEDDMGNYVKTTANEIKELFAKLEIKDGDYTTDPEIRAKKLADALLTAYSILGEKKTDGTAADGDAVYFYYFAVDQDALPEGEITALSNNPEALAGKTFFASNMTGNALEVLLGLNIVKDDSFEKAFLDAWANANFEFLASKDAVADNPETEDTDETAEAVVGNNYDRLTSSSNKVKDGQVIYVTYTKTWTEVDAEGVTTQKKETYTNMRLWAVEGDEYTTALYNSFKDKGVGSVADFSLPKGDVAGYYSFTNVKINWIVEDSTNAAGLYAPIVFEYTPYPEASTTAKPVMTVGTSTIDNVSLKAKKLTYYVFPAYYTDSPAEADVTAREIIEDILGDSITADVFSDETLALKNGDLTLETLINGDSTATATGDKLSLSDIFYYIKYPSYATKESSSETTTQVTTRYEGYLDARLKKIEAIEGIDAAALADFKTYTEDTLEDNYNAEIIANVADAIFHIIDKLEMNKDAKGNVLLPEKAVEEMYEILYENAEATFYTGTATVDGKTVSNYSIYGTFKQYLIDTRTEEGATTKLTFEEACDRVRDDARQFVERAVKIYYVANVYGLLISDKDYKELTYDDGNYSYYVGSYGDIGFKLAYQFDKLFTELLYVDGEKAAIEAYKTALESDPDAKYDFEIEYVDGKIKFDNVTYTIITED
ncbi:MAG: hypothetical protein IKV20_02400 [Clostridia bacterium]|nr:hypothetical protein [Clostridia bacterium]